MSTSFGRGLHAAPGRAVSSSAYDRYLGRWSRLTVPDLLAAAEVAQGHHVLDVWICFILRKFCGLAGHLVELY